MNTDLYNRTLGDRVRDNEALLSLDKHNINVGRNTSGDDPSIDSSDSSDNIRIQNVDIRTGARPKDSVSDEDDQSSDEPYEDQVDDPGQFPEKSDSSPSQVQKNLFKDTTPTNQSDGSAMEKAEVPKDQVNFMSKQMDESKVASFEICEERKDDVFKRLKESQTANRILNKRIFELDTQQEGEKLNIRRK
jgi:hypothetical protein